MTGELLQALEKNGSSQQAIAGISGAHLSLARVIDEYLLILEQCTRMYATNVVFIVEGRKTKQYYYRTLSLLLKRGDAQDCKIDATQFTMGTTGQIHPTLLTFSFYGAFLATRTRGRTVPHR